jgi:hypothetical protein
VIAGSMAGLALGSRSLPWLFPRAVMRDFTVLQFAVSGLCFMLPMLLSPLGVVDVAPIVLQIAFISLAMIAGTIFGMEFGVASLVRRGNVVLVASEIYGLDLLGSAVGALIVTVYAIPLLGVPTVSRLVGLVSGAAGALCFLRRGRCQFA